MSFGVFIPPACTSELSANLFGFVVLPLAQPDVATIGPLTAICRAIGLRPVAFTTARPVLYFYLFVIAALAAFVDRSSDRHDSDAEG